MGLRSASSRGGWIGLAAIGGGLLLEVVLVWLVARTWPGPAAAMLTMVAVALIVPWFVLAYWVWGFFSLRYELSRDGITIRWAANHLSIPMLDITHILSGRPFLEPVRGVRWPGYEVGRTRISLGDREAEPQERDALVYATADTDRQIVVVTNDLAYVLTPDDTSAFVREFKLRRRLGSVRELPGATEPSPWGRLTVFRDALGLRLVVVGLVVSALAFAWLIWHYPELPAEVSLVFRFDPTQAQGVASATSPLSSAWWLPVIGTATLALNTVLAVAVHQRTEVGSRLLILGAILVQVAVFVVLLKMS